MDDNFNFDDIDFNKTKRGKSKGKPSTKRWSFYIIEGILVLVAIVAGGRFLFSDSSDVSNLQATIDAQPTIAPSLTAVDLYNRALGEVDKGATSDAIQSLSYALELDPTYGDAYFQRAELYYDQKKYYEATRDYEAALRNGYEDVVFATYSLGMARYNREDYSNALTAFDEVTTLDPTYADAYYWRGRTQVQYGNYAQGIGDILYALEIGYDQPEYAYFYLGMAYDDAEDYESAVESYTRSLEYSTEDCELYYCWVDYNNRGTSYYRLENYQAAVDDYTRAIQVNPEEYPLSLQNRGDAYNKLGEIDFALGDWNTLFQLLEGQTVQFEITDTRRIVRESLTANDMQAYIEFEGAVGDIVTVELTIPEDSNLNSMLLLRDPNGSPLAFSAPGDTYDAKLSDVVLVEDGIYTIVVASNLAKSSGDFVLTFEK